MNVVSREWMIDTWSLANVRWSEYGREVPCWIDGTPVPYAVVVGCPWGPLRRSFVDQVEDLLDDVGDLERVSDRKWTLRYEDPSKIDPAALLERLKRALGWWHSDLDFRVERSGSSVVLEVVSSAS